VRLFHVVNVAGVVLVMSNSSSLDDSLCDAWDQTLRPFLLEKWKEKTGRGDDSGFKVWATKTMIGLAQYSSAQWAGCDIDTQWAWLQISHIVEAMYYEACPYKVKSIVLTESGSITVAPNHHIVCLDFMLELKNGVFAYLDHLEGVRVNGVISGVIKERKVIRD